MGKVKLSNDVTYVIEDYATRNTFAILLNGVSAENVLETMTEENLSVVQLLADSGAVTGEYRNQMLCGYENQGDVLVMYINDADLCRYGLALGDDKRIISALPQRYSPADAIIVDALPSGNVHDYLYINGEFVYDPLPAPDPVEPVPTDSERITALEQKMTALMGGVADVQ